MGDSIGNLQRRLNIKHLDYHH